MNGTALSPKSAAEILRDNRVPTASSASGRYYATCPKCSSKRKKAHQKLKCLGVTIDETGVKFGCNHCGWTGGEFYELSRGNERNSSNPAVAEKAKAKAAERQRLDAAESLKKARWLWTSRETIVGSIAETYLRDCRGYNGRLPGTLGFLPARGDHAPAMIAAFGRARETFPGELVIDNSGITGVHITKLKPDGSGKAGTEADKLTIGIANRSPIWLAPINDGLGLAIAEGIEDALSLHEATGLGAWAAGSASRLPALADHIPEYVETVSIAADDDDVGLKYAHELGPDHPTHAGMPNLNTRKGGWIMKADANSIMREHGAANLRSIFDQSAVFALPADDGYEPPTEYPESAASILDAAPPGETSIRFAPVAIDDVAIPDVPTSLIDGLLPARGLACVVGLPKSGKSFLTTDMLFSVARKALYAGRKTLPGAVVYLTGEGVNGFKRRLVAMRRHHGVEGQGVPFYMVDNVPDLGSEQTDLPRMLSDLDAFIADRAPDGVRAIVLDTLARCMGEADENAARDMGRFVNRCSAIERHFGCLVVVVHHVGKDPSRGGRGSNSLNGAADVTMTVEKTEAFSKVRIVEMKDGREGQEWRFRLIPYELGATFEHASATATATFENTTCVVEILSEPSQAQPRATNANKPPAGVAGDLLKIIRRSIEDMGATNIGSPAVPNNVRTVSRANLKNFCTTMAWQDEAEPNAFRAMMSKTLSQLRDKGLIDFDREWVWLT